MPTDLKKHLSAVSTTDLNRRSSKRQKMATEQSDDKESFSGRSPIRAATRPFAAYIYSVKSGEDDQAEGDQNITSEKRSTSPDTTIQKTYRRPDWLLPFKESTEAELRVIRRKCNKIFFGQPRAPPIDDERWKYDYNEDGTCFRTTKPNPMAYHFQHPSDDEEEEEEGEEIKGSKRKEASGN
ncbi:MAG: hypothetical protein M1837_004850 [Sclerophora amabilis]|nr:MAG: hypothetical protein M1837_004850 [Sclerophora amabilis]